MCAYAFADNDLNGGSLQFQPFTSHTKQQDYWSQFYPAILRFGYTTREEAMSKIKGSRKVAKIQASETLSEFIETHRRDPVTGHIFNWPMTDAITKAQMETLVHGMKLNRKQRRIIDTIKYQQSIFRVLCEEIDAEVKPTAEPKRKASAKPRARPSQPKPLGPTLFLPQTVASSASSSPSPFPAVKRQKVQSTTSQSDSVPSQSQSQSQSQPQSQSESDSVSAVPSQSDLDVFYFQPRSDPDSIHHKAIHPDWQLSWPSSSTNGSSNSSSSQPPLTQDSEAATDSSMSEMLSPAHTERSLEIKSEPEPDFSQSDSSSPLTYRSTSVPRLPSFPRPPRIPPIHPTHPRFIPATSPPTEGPNDPVMSQSQMLAVIAKHKQTLASLAFE